VTAFTCALSLPRDAASRVKEHGARVITPVELSPASSLELGDEAAMPIIFRAYKQWLRHGDADRPAMTADCGLPARPWISLVEQWITFRA
jgi:hypothetical protein